MRDLANVTAPVHIQVIPTDVAVTGTADELASAATDRHLILNSSQGSGVCTLDLQVTRKLRESGLSPTTTSACRNGLFFWLRVKDCREYESLFYLEGLLT